MAVLCIGIQSCNKGPINLTIKGKVTDPNTGIGVANVLVELDVQELSGGTFSSGFKNIASMTTDASGNYSFTFERRNAAAYKLVLSEPTYFGTDREINPDDLTTNNDNTQNFTTQTNFDC